MPTDFDAVRASYDAVSEEYAKQFFDELADKPLDRMLLDHLAEQTRGPDSPAPIADVGCGPGQVARYLHDRGVPAVGVDLSPSLVTVARALNPGIEFHVASMLDLGVNDATWAGILAFYSIIHLAEDEIAPAFAEFHRVLRPGGRLLLVFHAGDEVRHLDEWWGRQVSLDFRFFEVSDIAARLEKTGFTVDAQLERRNYPSEVETRRAYVLASRPAD